MTIQDIAARCSKFSGWNLTVKLCAPSTGYHSHRFQPMLEFFDPDDSSGQSRMVIGISPYNTLTEVYGRMRHWAIDLEEQRVMRDTLLAEIA